MLDKSFTNKCKVLVIDDQELAIGYLKYPLEKLGFHDVTFTDKVSSAITLISTRVYDLIICAYEFRKEKDGYFLYDELKRNNRLSLQTTFVFVSADTSLELINSIIELQPDDFLAKPFNTKELERRLHRALTRKRAMRQVYKTMQSGDYDKALELINRFLSDNTHADYFPTALKTKGEILLKLDDAHQARDFYQAIVDVQSFSWAQLGLIKSLLQMNDDTEAEKQILRLALKPDAQLHAYDLLTELQIKQKDYDTALDSTLVAAEASPRNLHRHRKTVDLSRLTNDYKTQFEASKKIVRYAKNSVHDKPDIYLDAARAGIDYAMTTEEEETNLLAKEATDYLNHFADRSDKKVVQDQIDVFNARLSQLNNDEKQAKALLQNLDSENWHNLGNEDLLDLSKAFHAVGMHDDCQQAIECLSERVTEKQGTDTLYAAFLRKEKKQKQEIRFTPKELNNKAVDFYKRGDNSNAMDTFVQAFTLMPKNTSIALNLLQTIAMKAQIADLQKEEKQLMKKCIYAIENGGLTSEQKERYLKVKTYLTDLS